MVKTNPDLEKLFERLSYFESHPEEKIHNRKEFGSVYGAVRNHYSGYLDQIGSILKEGNPLDEEQYQNLRKEVMPIYNFPEAMFKDLRIRICRAMEKHDLNELSRFIDSLEEKHYRLCKKLKEEGLTEEERAELDDVEERLYYITR